MPPAAAQSPTEASATAPVPVFYDGYPAGLRTRLLALRALILRIAAVTDGVGPLDETLKWGQPSFLTRQTGSGSTIRIDGRRGDPAHYALYVHCRSGLMDEFRALYGDVLHLEGDRAVVLPVDGEVPEDALGHCIALALTHHRRKGRGRR
ncbi:DUF1801 domain-containing protein [Phreatobacter sp.]|uniref:DUF1801 domain-containing protein n=1 Tax=Phreatobacter sp. TaxID=1966341 RepID=UPI003F700FA4